MSAQDHKSGKDPEIGLVNSVMEALYVAKRAFNLMPPLPEGMRALHIAVLSCVRDITPADGSGVRVTDISRAMHAHAPNTTKLVNELVKFRAVRKSSLEGDKRVVLVHLTPLGEQYVTDLVLKYHRKLESAFARIGNERCLETIETIHKIHDALRKIYE